MRTKAPIFDEVGHLPAGYSYLKTNDYRLYKSNPPFIKQLAAFPLLFMDLEFPSDDESWVNAKTTGFGKQFLFIDNKKADQVLTWGRCVIILLSVLLAIYVFKWAKEFFGIKAGIFALFLYAFEPNILAHSRIVTTDLGYTCFAFISFYYFVRLLREYSVKNLVLTMIFTGFAFISKYTSLFILPTFFLIAIVHIIFGKDIKFPINQFKKIQISNRIFKNVISLLVIFVLIVCFTYLTIVLDYGLKTSPVINSDTGQQRLEIALKKIPILGHGVISQRMVSFLKEISIPAREYFSTQISLLRLKPKIESDRGHAPYARYLMGKNAFRGFWYFPIIAAFIKEPIPLILLVLLSLLFIRRGDLLKSGYLLVPILFLFLIGIQRASFAYRYVNLPVLPFLIVFVSNVINKIDYRKSFKIVFIVLCSWYVFSTVRIFPHYLAYFNEVIGGPKNGRYYMVNSNLDWGQDLKLLKKYMDDKKLTSIKLSYFGTAVPEYYGINYEYMQGVSGATFDPDIKENPELNSRPGTGLIAISATCLQNISGFYPGISYDWLKKYKPVDHIGYSILIYDIEENSGIRHIKTEQK